MLALIRAVVILCTTLVLATSCSSSSSSSSSAPRTSTTLALRITADGVPVGARVLLIDAAGKPLQMGTIDLYGQRQGGAACPLADDAVGTWAGLIVGDGFTEVPVGADRCTPSPAIPFGRYTVKAWRGIEHERWEGEVDLTEGRGRVELAIALERAWAAPGTLAADMHIHAAGSNDSTMPDVQRVMAQAAAGVQVSALTNHGGSGSLDAAIRALHLEGQLAALPSIELGSDQLHVNVYPAPLPGSPAGGPAPAASTKAGAQAMFDLAHAYPGQPIVQLNHPRFRVTALFDGSRWNGTAWPPPFPRGFDAVEVINGFTAFNRAGDRRLDDSVRDFYTLTDHGWLVAPVGNSDTHDFNWVHDGLARTYVRVPDTRTEPFDQAGFIAAIRARRTVATTGPGLDVTVAPRDGGPAARPGDATTAEAGAVWVAVTVSQTRFVHVERIRVTVGTPTGPVVAHTIAVPVGVRSHTWAGRVEVGAADTWIGVTADGDTPLPIEQTGTYQRDKWKHPGNTPFAIASPILVDGDGDHRWRRGDADLDLGQSPAE